MEQEEFKPAYRLVGICKKCNKLRAGYLIGGKGPFTCYKCASEAANATPPATTNAPGTTYFTYTFTTSNSTSTVSPTGDVRWNPDYTDGTTR